MYQALYRRYRPKTFRELLGQHHITTTLKNQIKNENIGHAYLFSGTRGTGKTSAAKIFSRAINCLESLDGEPCNKCRNCMEILEETTVDVVEMDAASHNSVNDIRELREKVVYPPTNIKKKVYIIDEVHMLSTAAFNALLKTLEEPPKHLIFILATTEPEKIPQTIRSRCQYNRCLCPHHNPSIFSHCKKKTRIYIIHFLLLYLELVIYLHLQLLHFLFL